MTFQADLSGKVALVTGASSGLGRHFALTLARAGAKVALAARRLERLEELAEEIAVFDGRALPVALDVTDAASVAAALETTETELGPLSIAVNNAGIVRASRSLELSEAEWAETIETNLTGVFRVAQAAARRMVAAGAGGSIINIASILGLGGGAEMASYTAAKAGVINLTRTLAIEWARYGIRVNAVAPGYFVTDMSRKSLGGPFGEMLIKEIPQRRFGKDEDLDGVLLLLASSASEYITGSVLVVDGGLTIYGHPGA
jgi:NAD(P)-dependent dehydrogenase (short-subunit alcohol dehydrogenase family)